ncbi:MAG: hypothetical protein AB7S38_09165 [Vulcanimicrobiota bacterium]
MSSPIEEISSKNERRETALEMWAAAIYANEARRGAGPGQDNQLGTGGSTFRKELLNRVDGPKQTQKVAETSKVNTDDRVESVTPSEETATISKMQAAARTIKAKPVTAAPAAAEPAPPPVPVQQQAEVVRHEASQPAATSLAAEVTRPEELPAQPAAAAISQVARPVKVNRSEESREPASSQAADESEESPERVSLLTPGDSIRAKAYVPAREVLGDDDQGLADFMIAL